MIEIFKDEHDRTIHRGPVQLRQSQKATASLPGRLLLLCPYGHLVDSCETGTLTASTWISDESSGTPRVVECGGRLPQATPDSENPGDPS